MFFIYIKEAAPRMCVYTVIRRERWGEGRGDGGEMEKARKKRTSKEFDFFFTITYMYIYIFTCDIPSPYLALLYLTIPYLDEKKAHRLAR